MIPVAGTIRHVVDTQRIRTQNFNGLTQQFVTRITENFFGYQVEQKDPAFPIHFNDGIGRGLQELTEAALNHYRRARFLLVRGHLEELLLNQGKLLLHSAVAANSHKNCDGTLSVSSGIAPWTRKNLHIND